MKNKKYIYIGAAVIILVIATYFALYNKKEGVKISNIIPNNKNIVVGEKYESFIVSKLLTEYNPEVGGRVEFLADSKIKVMTSVEVENFEYKTVMINSETIKDVAPRLLNDERGCELTSDKKEVRDIISSLNNGDKITFELEKYDYDNRGIAVYNACYTSSITKN